MGSIPSNVNSARFMWGANPHSPTRSNYAVCLQMVYVLAVWYHGQLYCGAEASRPRNGSIKTSLSSNNDGYSCWIIVKTKQDSATHGTKNMIANRRMAVSERSLIGRAAGYRGSIPFYDCWERACQRRFESFRSDGAELIWYCMCSAVAYRDMEWGVRAFRGSGNDWRCCSWL